MIKDQWQAIGETKDLPARDVDGLKSRVGEPVAVTGALHKIRNIGQIVFLIVRTFRDRLQVVLQGEGIKFIEGIEEGDFLKIDGRIIVNNKVREGIELIADRVEKLSGACREDVH